MAGCSPLIPKIRIRYRDEDGDTVNVCEADILAFSEMLRTEKENPSTEDESSPVLGFFTPKSTRFILRGHRESILLA